MCPVDTSAVGRSTDRAGRRDSFSIGLGNKATDELDISLATLISKVIDNKPFDEDWLYMYKRDNELVDGERGDDAEESDRSGGCYAREFIGAWEQFRRLIHTG
mgnify:CR=1 FL=1